MAEIGLPDPEYSEPNNFMVKLVLRNNIRQCVPYLNETEGMTTRKVIAELGYPSEGALVKWVREDPRGAGCTPTSVYQWMRRYHSEGILGLMNARNAPMPAESMPGSGGDGVEGLRRQVEALRLENAVMRETINVLFLAKSYPHLY